MPRKQIDIWKYLNSYPEEDYVERTGEQPYMERFDDIPTLEYVKAVVSDTEDEHGGIEECDVEEWYENEIKPIIETMSAPEITDLVPRIINVYFIKEYKFFFNKNNKKRPVDYVLNVDKIISEKNNGAPPIVFNSVQIFMLNYEIKKLLDKAVTIANEKYDNIVYINNNLSIDGISNVMEHLAGSYDSYKFNFILLDKEDEFAELDGSPNLQRIKSLF